jgi:hypothetical protein
VTQKQRYNFPLPQATPCNILSVRSFWNDAMKKLFRTEL